MKCVDKQGHRLPGLVMVFALAVCFLFMLTALRISAVNAAPTGVTAESYNYKAIKISWQMPEGADSFRVYRYHALQEKYLVVGETTHNNYIVYDLVPGTTYYFWVTACYTENGSTTESEPSASVKAKPGESTLDSISEFAPTPMFTIVDDDTRDPYSVKLFHDICEANGVRGCYAVVTSNFGKNGADGYGTMLDQLRAYEADGFDMLLHARDHDSRFLLKNRTTDGWNNHTAEETATMAAQSIAGGYSDMTAAGLGHPSYWVAPMGVHDPAITAAAQNAGVETLLSVANKAYVSKNPKASSYNRMFVPRVELYGTDGAYDAQKKNHQTERHSSDRIWNTSSDVKAQIDAAKKNNAWVIICTHVYESEWYLPRITLTKSEGGYTAAAYGNGLTAVWNGNAAVSLTEQKYTFIYDKRNNVEGWYFEEGGTPQNLADYGISLTGTPVYNKGDANKDSSDRSGFYSERFAEIVSYAREKGLTNVTFSEGYAAWSRIYDAQEAADACHDLSFEEGVPATCKTEGQREHYLCSVCGDRFADEDGHTLLSDRDIVIPKHTDLNGDYVCDYCDVSLRVPILEENVSLYSQTVTYNGKVRTPAVTVKNQEGAKLTPNIDYSVFVPSGRTDAGLYVYIITGKGHYSGTVQKIFTINPQPLKKAGASLYSHTVTYNGKMRTPVVTVKNSSGAKLVSGIDYTVDEPGGRTDAGLYTYTITGNGNYTGTIQKIFTINPQPLKEAGAFLYSQTVTYNGKMRTPVVTVKNSSGAKLVSGIDYTVDEPGGRTYPGIYSYTITGNGNFTGTVNKDFVIKPYTVKASDITLYSQTVTYNGKVRTPAITVKTPWGETLTEGTHYNVIIPKGRKDPGTYTYKFSFKGNFTGTVDKVFTILSK